MTTVAAIRKRNKRWFAEVRKGGYPARRKSFRTKGEADKWATAIEAAIDAEEDLPSQQSLKRTVADMLERYKKTEAPKKKDKRNVIRHADFWIEKIGSLRLGHLTRAQVVEIRDELAKDRSPATVNRYLATLRHACNLAATDWEWMRPVLLRKLILKESRGRVRFLDQDETDRLLKATRNTDNNYLYPIVLIALTTGARRREILDLRWQDVDLITGRAIVQETKNTDRRSLALIPVIVEELRTLRKVRRIDNDFVFAHANTGDSAYYQIEKAWRQARAAAKIENFRFHDLRHSCASNMAKNGATTTEIAAVLGHRTLEMVKRYSHLTEQHALDVAERTALKLLSNTKH